MAAIHKYNIVFFLIRKYLHKRQSEKVKMVHISFASQKAKTDKKISVQNSQHHEEKGGTYFRFENNLVTISLIVLKVTLTRPCFSLGAN